MKVPAQRGFTLIELMIVVAIIGILAAIAIPKFAQMMEKSREGATKGNIASLRSAISIYQGDWQGAAPVFLSHWFSTGGASAYIDSIPPVKVTGNNPMAGSNNGLGLGGNKVSGWNSPASSSISENPLSMTAAIFNTSSGYPSGKGWAYDNGGATSDNQSGLATGYIYVNNTTVDSSRLSYTTYGY